MIGKLLERILLVLSILLAYLGVKIAIQSLDQSKEAFNASVKQYNEGSKSAQVQFDTMANLLNKFQQINKNVLDITHLQLEETRSMLHQITILGRPNLYIEKANWNLDPNDQRFSFKSFINLMIGNKGVRDLKVANLMLYIVEDERVVSSQYFDKLNQKINTNNNFLISVRTKYTLSDKFFVYLKFDYSDIETHEKMYREFFLENDDSINDNNYLVEPNTTSFSAKKRWFNLNVSPTSIELIKNTVNNFQQKNLKTDGNYEEDR